MSYYENYNSKLEDVKIKNLKAEARVLYSEIIGFKKRITRLCRKKQNLSPKVIDNVNCCFQELAEKLYKEYENIVLNDATKLKGLLDFISPELNKLRESLDPNVYNSNKSLIEEFLSKNEHIILNRYNYLKKKEDKQKSINYVPETDEKKIQKIKVEKSKSINRIPFKNEMSSHTIETRATIVIETSKELEEYITKLEIRIYTLELELEAKKEKVKKYETLLYNRQQDEYRRQQDEYWDEYRRQQDEDWDEYRRQQDEDWDEYRRQQDEYWDDLME